MPWYSLNVGETYFECFVFSGDRDPVVQVNWGRLSEQLFREMGFQQYSFKEYRGLVHSSNDEVIFIID